MTKIIAETDQLRHKEARIYRHNRRSFAYKGTSIRESQAANMIHALDYAPIAATAFAVPQFLPQILKFRATRDTAGLSRAWATLTCLNNAAWIAYFALEHYWTALVPSSSATALAGTLAILLCVKDRPRLRPSLPIAAWAAMLVAAYLILGRTGLGALLTAAFVVQVAPSIWTAYRTERPTGVSAGTWLLILGELSCWLTFGLYKSDPRLIALGLTGVAASALMLARIRRASRRLDQTHPARPRGSRGNSEPSAPRRARGPAGASAASGAGRPRG
jgi:uncharacterized protein with PQ loop repeat